MAQRRIEKACDGLRQEMSAEDAKLVESTEVCVDDIQMAIQQFETQLATKKGLRNLGRLIPFVDAMKRFSGVVETALDGTSYLPWIWAPVKFVLQIASDYTHALDKIITAYGEIGDKLPRFSRFAKTFPTDRAFQGLIAFLFEDIMEFHKRAYALVTKRGWRMLFNSAWGRFDFKGLLTSIGHMSEQIDLEAASINIVEATEWRAREVENFAAETKRRHIQQFQDVLKWLDGADQEMKFEGLTSRCYEGTSEWFKQPGKMSDWLQPSCDGDSVLWVHGKPGSGKSVLASKLIQFLRNEPNRRVGFFFCDHRTPSEGVYAFILRAFVAQVFEMSQGFAPFVYDELVPFVYDEYVGKGKKPSLDNLNKLIPDMLGSFEDLCLVVDGVDEVASSEQRGLVKDLLRLANSNPNLKLLIVSQDIPSIAFQLSKKPRLCLNDSDAKRYRENDLALLVRGTLQEIDEQHDGAIGEERLEDLKTEILKRTEDMFLWASLILDILSHASSLEDLWEQIGSLPSTLTEAYKKILSGICDRASANKIAKIRRIFSWVLYQRTYLPVTKGVLGTAMNLYPGFDRMTPERMPFANATDICKPLLQDGPGDSLVFVHSTVAQFLTDQSSGPFLDEAESQANIAFACICQINQCFESGEGICSDNFHGVCDLYDYARRHWADHLLSYLARKPVTSPSDMDPVECQTVQLLELTIQSLHANGIEPWPKLNLHLPQKRKMRLVPVERLCVGFYFLPDSRRENVSEALTLAMQRYKNTARRLLDPADSTIQQCMASGEEHGPTLFSNENESRDLSEEDYQHNLHKAHYKKSPLESELERMEMMMATGMGYRLGPRRIDKYVNGLMNLLNRQATLQYLVGDLI